MSQLTTIEALYEKMGEYTKMDEELPFPEFQSYYQDLIDFLMRHYQEMEQEQLIQLKGMCMIVAGNAKSRAMKKDANAKKFNKMSEKAHFWEEAIKLNLTKAGLSADDLDARVGELWSDDAPTA